MNETKIKQIIPAPSGLWAVYENDGKKFRMPIVCLCLKEDSSGQFIEPCTIDSEGIIDCADSPDNFKYVDW